MCMSFGVSVLSSPAVLVDVLVAAETKKISKKRVTAAGEGGEAGLARFIGGLGEVKILPTPSRYPLLKTDVVSGVIHC